MAPFTVVSTVEGDEVFWLDHRYNIKSVRFDGFEATPPSVLHVAPENILTRRDNPRIERGNTFYSQLIGPIDSHTKGFTVIEQMPNRRLTCIRTLDVDGPNVNTRKVTTLGMSQAIDKIWTVEHFGRLLTVGARGICGVWHISRDRPVRLSTTLCLDTDPENLTGLTLLGPDGPLVYHSRGRLRTMSMDGTLIQEQTIEIDQASFLGLRTYRDSVLVIAASNGQALWASFELSESHSCNGPFDFRPFTFVDDDSGHTMGRQLCVFPVETVHQPSISQKADSLVMYNGAGLLAWLELENDRWSLKRNLIMGTEDLTKLAVMQERKVACGESSTITIP